MSCSVPCGGVVEGVRHPCCPVDLQIIQDILDRPVGGIQYRLGLSDPVRHHAVGQPSPGGRVDDERVEFVGYDGLLGGDNVNPGIVLLVGLVDERSIVHHGLGVSIRNVVGGSEEIAVVQGQPSALDLVGARIGVHKGVLRPYCAPTLHGRIPSTLIGSCHLHIRKWSDYVRECAVRQYVRRVPD